MELMVSARITGDELADELYYEDADDIIKWILDLDLRFGDTEFTTQLIQGLVKSLRREGINAKLKIKEDTNG